MNTEEHYGWACLMLKMFCMFFIKKNQPNQTSDPLEVINVIVGKNVGSTSDG